MKPRIRFLLTDMIQVENKQDLENEFGKSKRVLVLFYASWCPYCLRFVPTFEKKVANLRGSAIVEVILDDYDNELWDDYSIDAVPTVIMFENGGVCSRLDGGLGRGLNEKQLETWLDKELKFF